jgi:hypothetical protein
MGVKRSQCEVMWELLQDGGWHTNAELWEHGIGRPNSRACELRARHGATIVHDVDPDEHRPAFAHRYRLVADPPATADGQLILVAA